MSPSSGQDSPALDALPYPFAEAHTHVRSSVCATPGDRWTTAREISREICDRIHTP
jgi:hypothetical protein